MITARFFFATDPFAMERRCATDCWWTSARSEVKVNEHPRYNEYLHLAEQYGLGVASFDRNHHIVILKRCRHEGFFLFAAGNGIGCLWGGAGLPACDGNAGRRIRSGWRRYQTRWS
jgi:hypothetical protein